MLHRNSLLLILVGLVSCNNYGLDDRIRNAINGASNSALSLTAPTNQPIVVQNRNTQLATIQFAATGGNQPYNFSLTTSNIPANMIMSISATGLVTVTRNTSIGYPSNVSHQNQNNGFVSAGSISVKVVDSNGDTKEVSYQINVRFKRVFITSGTSSPNFGTMSGVYASCANATKIQAANCACQLAAASANMPTSGKFRAWISYSGVHARCNITNNPDLACPSVAPGDGGPWYTTPGQKIIDDTSSTAAIGLFAGASPLQTTLDKNEIGNTATTDAFTGSDGLGVANANTCGNWTGAGNAQLGDRTQTTPSWTLGTAPTCGAAQAFYCFESD